MAKHGIQKSRHLLKNLEEEMIFLRTLVSQMESLSHQVHFGSSGIKRTWSDIDRVHKGFEKDAKNP